MYLQQVQKEKGEGMNMKKMKKIFAVILSLAMVLGMSVMTFANPNEWPTYTASTANITGAHPSESDQVNVTIQNISGNPTVNLYQIARAKYGAGDKQGYIGLEWANGISGITFPKDNAELSEEKKLSAIGSANQITNIANSLTNLPKEEMEGENKDKQYTTFGTDNTKIYVKSQSITGTNTSYTEQVHAGVYIAIITGASDGSVYNPILLTASYKAGEGTGSDVIAGGTIDAGSNYNLLGTTAVAKKTTPGVDKKIANAGDNTTEKNVVIDTAKGADNNDVVQIPGKNTVGTTEEARTNPTQGATASLGDVIPFEITPSPMPSYPKDASDKTLFITDTMQEGLTFNFESLKITLGDSQLNRTESTSGSGESAFKIYYYTSGVGNNSKTVARGVKIGNGFKVVFNYENLITDAETGAVTAPTIRYTATVNENAVVGTPGNTNTTTLYYSNKPNSGSTYNPKDEELPNDPPEGYGTKKDEETIYTYKLAFRKVIEGSAVRPGAPLESLAGAVFGIYSDPSCTENTKVQEVTTDENGYAVSKQIAAGDYYIKEMTPPKGYSLNDKIYKVHATWSSATYTTTTTDKEYKVIPENDDSKEQTGWLNSEGVYYPLDTQGINTEDVFPAYTVNLSKKVTTITVENGKNGVLNDLIEVNANGNPVVGSNATKEIPNTKLAQLPSTGGIGTTIFTIGGCAIMIIAAALFFASRRKNAK